MVAIAGTYRLIAACLFHMPTIVSHVQNKYDIYLICMSALKHHVFFSGRENGSKSSSFIFYKRRENEDDSQPGFLSFYDTLFTSRNITLQLHLVWGFLSTSPEDKAKDLRMRDGDGLLRRYAPRCSRCWRNQNKCGINGEERMYRRHLFEDYGNMILIRSWCDVHSVKIMSNKIILNFIIRSNLQFEPVVPFLLMSESKKWRFLVTDNDRIYVLNEVGAKTLYGTLPTLPEHCHKVTIACIKAIMFFCLGTKVLLGFLITLTCVINLRVSLALSHSVPLLLSHTEDSRGCSWISCERKSECTVCKHTYSPRDVNAICTCVGQKTSRTYGPRRGMSMGRMCQTKRRKRQRTHAP